MEVIAWLESLDGPIDGVAAWDGAERFSMWGSSSEERELFVTALVGSLDAALALAERVLPGSWAHICTLGGRVWLHSPYSSGGGPRWRGKAKTPALALCAAILRALKETGDE